MRAVLVRAYGPPSGFSVESVPMPVPRAGEIRIAVAACGVSFLDLLVGQGRYQVKPPLPFSPGSEFAGVVDALGAGVSGHSIGDRVCASAVYGAFAEYACVRADAVHRIPDAMGFEEASIFGVSYATAFYALVQRGGLKPGETLFVLGAGGAVGSAAIQIGKMLGARVIAGASTCAKREFALVAGADLAVDTSLLDWRAALKEAKGNSDWDVVLDPVGGASSEPAFRSLRWGGRHLVVGFASGKIAALPLNLALLKGASLVGVDIKQFNERQPDVAAANFSQLVAAYEREILRPTIANVLALEDFCRAMELASTGMSPGRLVLSNRLSHN